TRARLTTPSPATMDRADAASERRLHVLEPHQRAVAVDLHADGVEAQLRGPRTVVDLGQPRDPHAPDLPALGLAQAVPRIARAGAAGLDLAEHQHLVVGHHEVELAEAGAVVARDDPVAEALEVLRGELLAEAAERVAGVV